MKRTFRFAVLFLACAFPLFAQNNSAVLTNWLTAQRAFLKTGDLIGARQFDAAKSSLRAASISLPQPYANMATQFLATLDALAKETADEQRDSAFALCVALQSPAAALKFKPPKKSADDDDETSAWCLFETGKTREALAEYRRRLKNETVPHYKIYYDKQIELLGAFATRANEPQFAVQLAGERYLRGLEEKPDFFSALRALHRALPHAKTDADGVAVHQQIIKCLAGLGDFTGAEAWEDKLLAQFSRDSNACAKVFLDRGLRAFYGPRDLDAALRNMRKAADDYPNTAAWGDAVYGAGLVLQEQKKFDDAIAMFARIFPSALKDHELREDSPDDCKNYRSKAALRTAECYEAKGDLSRAVEFGEQAEKKYAYVSFCHDCQEQTRKAVSLQVEELRRKLRARN